MERWEEGFYITAMAGSAGGSSLVVMSKGTPYTQQSYKVGPHSPSPMHASPHPILDDGDRVNLLVAHAT